MNIGVEPTTDKFTAVCWSKDDGLIPGASLALYQNLPFSNLNQFGNDFMSRLEGSMVNAEILKYVTFIDTPGLLSTTKDNLGRRYDIHKILEVFADLAEMIILFLDPFKLDMGHEIEQTLRMLTYNQQEKLRIILNKADQIEFNDLMRCYGALMFNLGKVIKTPEIPKVYMSSFWNNQ